MENCSSTTVTHQSRNIITTNKSNLNIPDLSTNNKKLISIGNTSHVDSSDSLLSMGKEINNHEDDNNQDDDNNQKDNDNQENNNNQEDSNKVKLDKNTIFIIIIILIICGNIYLFYKRFNFKN